MESTNSKVEPGAILLRDLLQCLVECSEKSAKLAQTFRNQNDLFDLLIQEKGQVECNKRFFQDFKTLADVLVQETIKKDVGRKFPELVPQILGEEQNSFQNSQGESIDVVLSDSVEETASLLCKVLDGRDSFARAVADIVHSTVTDCDRQCSSSSTHSLNKLGIWIDPIDSTAEFIEGKYEETEEHVMQRSGLRCVCVLIGAYDLETFSPVLGVVNQPFYSKNSEKEKWKSKFYWGFHYGDESTVSPSINDASNHHSKPVNDASESSRDRDRIILVSASEDPELLEIMRREYKLIQTAGAGHKALLVAIEEASFYILSKSTTYYWDTCGPHAILNALGGGILRFREAINDCDEMNLAFLQKHQVRYEAVPGKEGIDAFQNCEGLLAYKNADDVMEFMSFLRSNGYVAT